MIALKIAHTFPIPGEVQLLQPLFLLSMAASVCLWMWAGLQHGLQKSVEKHSSTGTYTGPTGAIGTLCPSLKAQKTPLVNVGPEDTGDEGAFTREIQETGGSRLPFAGPSFLSLPVSGRSGSLSSLWKRPAGLSNGDMESAL